MRTSAPRIGAELLTMGLVLGTTAGALALVLSVYKARGPAPKPPSAVIVASVAPPAPKPEPKPEPEPEPSPPAPAPVDLTPARLAEIAAREAEQAEAARAADRKAEALEAAAAKARAEAERVRTRERLIRQGAAVAELAARKAEDEADDLARERDILAAKRDELRTELDTARLRAKDGVAILPYKGPNGTWRRPIPIECRGDTATIQPGGPSYDIGKLIGMMNPRMHPMVTAVARIVVRTRDLATPDGQPSEPYILFLVRPDGVKPFYAARGMLEPLKIAYGYELVDADWDIEFPDLNDPSEWGEGAGPRKAPTWPPPPSAAELADARGAGIGPGVGPGAPGGTGGSPAGGRLGAGRPGDGRAPGSSLPGRFDGGAGGVGVSPSQGGGTADAAGGRSRWDRGNTGGLTGAVEPDELEEILRGTARTAYTDGRVPIYPGSGGGDGEGLDGPQPEEPPTVYDPDVPTRGGVADPRRDPGRPQPEGSPGRVAGLLGERGGRPSGLPGSRSLRETIARNEGLEAPKLAPPSRSIPGALGSGTGTGTGLGADAPAATGPPGAARPGSVANSGAGSGPGTATASPSSPAPSGSGTSSARGGTPNGRPGGAAGGAPGLVGVPGVSGGSAGSPGAGTPMPGASGGGGVQGGQEAGSGSGWDDSNGVHSKSFEVSVACGPKSLTIHPGGRTIELEAMKGDDAAFPAALAQVVKARMDAEPNVGLRTRVRFLVKPGGESTYLKARYQFGRAGTGWPTVLQMADGAPPRLFDGGKP